MRRTAVIAIVLALVVAACGGGDAETTTTPSTRPTTTTSTRPTTTTSTRPTTTTTEEDTGPRSPLNGLPVDDPATLERRALVVKIDNHVNARPQSGLASTDAMLELPVEGITRLVAVFHTGDSDRIGPIRSVRPTDWQVARLFDGPLVVSGGQNWVIRRNLDNDADIIGDVGSPVTFRSSSRSAPHNLYGDTEAIRALADDRDYPDEPPAQLWAFGPLPEGGEAAETIRIDFSDSLVAGWEWDGSEYLRSTNGVEHDWITDDGETEQIRADVIVVLVTDAGLVQPPPGGGVAMGVDSIGSGRAVVFADGRVVEGSWSRPRASAPIALETAEGEPLTVPPGHPWITFVPRDGEIDW
jgi:hypothetical protein